MTKPIPPMPTRRPIPPMPTRKPTPLYKDSVGRDIPAWLNDIWEGREHIEDMIRELKHVRTHIESGHVANDKAVMRIHATTMASLQAVERQLRDAMPYALCPYCQGADGGCKACVDGFVSRLVYDTVVPSEMKQIGR